MISFLKMLISMQYKVKSSDDVALKYGAEDVPEKKAPKEVKSESSSIGQIADESEQKRNESTKNQQKESTKKDDNEDVKGGEAGKSGQAAHKGKDRKNKKQEGDMKVKLSYLLIILRQFTFNLPPTEFDGIITVGELTIELIEFHLEMLMLLWVARLEAVNMYTILITDI